MMSHLSLKCMIIIVYQIGMTNSID